MQPKRFGIKYFVQGDIHFDMALLVPIFQRWIQQHTVEGLLIDVADYKHVHQGPGIMLIGHEGDYSFDLRAGRPGLLYTRKRELHATIAEDLREAFRLARIAAQKLQEEESLNNLRFELDYAEVIFFDRLALPNTSEAFENLRNTLQEVVTELYPNAEIQVASIETDARKPLTVRVGVLQEQGVN